MERGPVIGWKYEGENGYFMYRIECPSSVWLPVCLYDEDAGYVVVMYEYYGRRLPEAS